jgi:hypothetical protein
LSFSDEVLCGQIKKIKSANQLEPGGLNEMDSKDNGKSPEGECPDDAVPERLLLQPLRKGVRKHSQDNGVVRAEYPFEENKRKDDEDVVNVDGLSPSSMPESPSRYELPRPCLPAGRLQVVV